jgi:hypothetical protein
MAYYRKALKIHRCKKKYEIKNNKNLTRKDTLNLLSESSVTTAWRVLRLRMEDTASRYGG